MDCCRMSFGFWRADVARDARGSRRDSRATGTRSLAERPIAAVWPEGQRAFGAFLSRLGGGNDSADFDRFMTQRAGRLRG